MKTTTAFTSLVRPPPPPPTETASSLGSKASGTTALPVPAAAKPVSQAGDPKLQARLQADTFAPASGRKLLSLTGANENPVRPFAGPSPAVQTLAGPGTTGASGAASKPGVQIRNAIEVGGGGGYTLSTEDRDKAERLIIEAFDRGDTQPIVDWLRDHSKPEERAAFMDVLFGFGPGAGELLNNVGNLATTDKYVLANSLNAAYERGTVTDEEIQNAVVAAGHGAPFHEAHEGLGEVVGLTRNPALISTYASSELEVARGNNGLDLARVDAAARALTGLRPDDLQEYLSSNPDDVSFIVDNFNEATEGSYLPPEALGTLLDNAADIHPPTDESLALFERSIPHLGENQASREAAAEFFSQNTDEILAWYTDDSGSLTLEGQEKLGHFFGNTLFSEPAIDNQGQLQSALLGKLEELSDALEPEANANPPSLAAQEQARLLGSLIGTVEGGFQFAVDELDQKNEATEGFVDFLFQAGSLIPDLPFPGGGLVKDVTLDQLQDWVTDSLTEDAEKAEDALPFHAAFAQGIDNPLLRTTYDSARADVFLNVVQELID